MPGKRILKHDRADGAIRILQGDRVQSAVREEVETHRVRFVRELALGVRGGYKFAAIVGSRVAVGAVPYGVPSHIEVKQRRDDVHAVLRRIQILVARGIEHMGADDGAWVPA